MNQLQGLLRSSPTTVYDRVEQTTETGYETVSMSRSTKTVNYSTEETTQTAYKTVSLSSSTKTET